MNIVQVMQRPNNRYRIALQFNDSHCALAAEARDFILLPTAVLQVVRSLPPSGAGVQAIVLLRMGSPAGVVPGPAVYRSPWRPGSGDPPECFVQTVPASTSAVGIDTNAAFRVRFSEVMDPVFFRAMESVAVRRANAASAIEEPVVGEVTLDPDLRGITFTPSLRLAHTAGSSETLLLRPLGRSPGCARPGWCALAARLAGRAVPDQQRCPPGSIPAASHCASLPSTRTGNGAPELRGQFLANLQATRVAARPVTRFSAQADGSTLTTGAMTPFQTGTPTPLNPLGAHMQTPWRYVDLGFSLLDESTMNVDVEGLAWAPSGGQVVADSFSNFEMSLGHASEAPDEVLSAVFFPTYPNSGLQATYANNEAGGMQVVHPGQNGYVIDPLDVFTAPSGTAMIPWPLNRGPSGTPQNYFTWRDTRSQVLGGSQSGGVDPRVLFGLQGIPAPPPVYAAGRFRPLVCRS